MSHLAPKYFVIEWKYRHSPTFLRSRATGLFSDAQSAEQAIAILAAAHVECDYRVVAA